MRPFSLSTKMSWAVSLLVAGILSLLAFSAQHYFENQFKETISRQQFTMVSALAEQIDDKIISAHEQLIVVARAMSPELARDGKRAQRFLDNRLISRQVFDGGIFLLSPSGTMYAGTAMEPQMREKDYSFREYFQRTVATGKPQISEPLLTSRSSGNPTIVFTAPIFGRDDGPAAVLVGAIDLMKDNFLGKLAEVRIARTGYVYLYNTSRTIIIHPDRKRILKQDVPPGANRLFDRAIEGFEGTGATVTSRGMHALSSFKHLKATNWILAANYPEAEAYASIYRAKRYFLMALAPVLIVTVLLVWLFMHRLTAPLRAFTGHVRNVAADEEEHGPIVVATRDEIGTLAETFNRMMARLDSRSAALREEKEKIKHTLSLLGATLESTADGILVTESGGGIVLANRRFSEILGCGDHSSTGEWTQDVICIRERLDAMAAFQATLRKLAARPEVESHDILEIADGRTFELFSRPQRIEEEIVGRVWSFRDITARKELEARLRHAQKMEAIGTLAGGIAHDFNTILTAIKGYGTILQDEADRNTPAAESYLAEIEAAVDRGAALTMGLLTYSRKEAGNPVRVDLNFIVRQMTLFMGNLLTDRIELATILADRDLPVMADVKQIEQVLMNLATNGRDAMESGGKLTVRTGVVEADDDFVKGHGLERAGNYALLSIADTGGGMEPETLERIFEPFFSTKGVGHGTGLGLSIVYGIVQQHKGCITVTSRRGAGTDFSIYLPLLEMEEAASMTT
jgi:PAS domain S-box-containing protein